MNKSYFAVIPADVRYDKKLPMGARLLYGEITALCNEKGFCWASNKYFAELYDVTTVTVSNWVSELINGGYIISNFRYLGETKAIENRCLSIKENFNTYSKNLYEGIKENFNTPIKENFKQNNTSINTTFNNKERKKEDYNSLIDAYTQNNTLKETLLEFIKMRKLIKKPLTDKALKLTMSKLDKLAQTDTAKIHILEQSIESCWQGIYPLKEEKPKGRVYE